MPCESIELKRFLKLLGSVSLSKFQMFPLHLLWTLSPLDFKNRKVQKWPIKGGICWIFSEMHNLASWFRHNNLKIRYSWKHFMIGLGCTDADRLFVTLMCEKYLSSTHHATRLLNHNLKNSNIRERERERVQGPGWSNLTSKQNSFPIEA